MEFMIGSVSLTHFPLNFVNHSEFYSFIANHTLKWTILNDIPFKYYSFSFVYEFMRPLIFSHLVPLPELPRSMFARRLSDSRQIPDLRQAF